MSTVFSKNKSYDVESNAVNKIMKKNKIGKCSKQVYAQFIYKIEELKQKYRNISIGFFAPPLFISGESFDGFRKSFNKTFNFSNGMLFQASNFADVKGQWGISFTVWNPVFIQ